MKRKTKLAAAVLAAGSTMALGASGTPAHAATTYSVTPAAPTATANSQFPFGRGNWNQMGWIYKNLQPFSLKAGDTIAFDLVQANDVALQMDISMVATTVSGGDLPAGAFTRIVPNTAVPTGSGNTVVGDYDLAYTVTAPFTFAGGGLIIKFSNPGAALVADATPTFVQAGLLTNAADPSGMFVSWFAQDADGAPPWSLQTNERMGGFRLSIADPVVKKKKCKKKKGKAKASAKKKKKCKKKGKKKK